jgi:hypothetical protein
MVVAVGAAALRSWPRAAPASATAAQPAAGAPRQLLFIDPATGLPRDPTPAELHALQSQTVATPPQPIVSPTTGLTGLALSDDQMVYSVATKGPDGKIVMSEVRGAKAAARVVAESGAPVLQAEKEKRDDR